MVKILLLLILVENIYWESTGSSDTIIGLSSIITPINDSSNVTITGTYTGETSRVYLIRNR